MNPYDIDYENLPESKKITDPNYILRLKLAAQFYEITKKLTTEEVLEKTGLDPSDYSRLKISSVKRFTIDRLIKITHALGYEATIKLTPIKDKKAGK